MNLEIRQELPAGAVVEPLTRAQVKNYLRLDWLDTEEVAEAALIDNMITNARKQGERFMHVDIVPKEYEFYLQSADKPFYLPYGPLNITRDTDGVLTNLTVEIDGVSIVEGEGFELLGTNNPKVNITSLNDAFRITGRRNTFRNAMKVRIEYETAGITDGSADQGLLGLCAWLYYGREAKMMTNWKSWLAPFKVKRYYGTR